MYLCVLYVSCMYLDCIRVYLYVLVYICMYPYVCLHCMYLLVLFCDFHIRMYLYVSVCICIYRQYMYVYVCICTYCLYSCIDCMCLYCLYQYVPACMYGMGKYRYIQIHTIHTIHTYAFGGVYMHTICTVHMCMYLTPRHNQYIHALFDTYRYAHAGSLMSTTPKGTPYPCLRCDTVHVAIDAIRDWIDRQTLDLLKSQ